jgi:hypothetical protein
VAALLALAATAAAAGWLALRLHHAPAAGARRAHAGPPHGWRLAGETLRVEDADGRLVFEHRFGFEVAAMTSQRVPAGEPTRVQLADVDDDGRLEVLVAVPAIRREERRLYCFESEGRLRFVLQPAGDVRFGSVDYRSPWQAFGVWTTRSTGGKASLWVAFVHSFLFPTRLQRLDPRGELLAEYWNDGYVLSVNEGRWQGRDAVLVGGVNNELKDASLAIFDREAFGGSAPAVNPEYRCGACAPGGPRELVAIPSSCLLRRVGGIAGVVAVSVAPGDQLEARVVAGLGRPGALDGVEPAVVHYTLGPDLAPVRLEVSPEFRALHDALRVAGRIDHAFGAEDEAALLRLRRFAGGRFVALPPRLDR